MWCLGSASLLQIRLKIPPPWGKKAGGASAHFFGSKQAVPGNAVNRDLALWAGPVMGPPRPEWVAEAFSLGSALRSSGLEEKGQERACWAASGFFRVRAWVPRPFSRPWAPPHLVVKPAQLCFQTHTSLGKHPDLLQEPLEKGQKGKKRVVL